MIIMASLFMASCQLKTSVAPVDLTAAKEDVTKLLDKFHAGMISQDANALITLFTDDCLACGTDSKELLNKADWNKMLTQAFADTTLKMNFTIDKRDIRISKDGKAAVALEQAFINSFSEKMPCRFVYHAVKNDSGWQLDFMSVSFIPNNEDLAKLNKALE